VGVLEGTLGATRGDGVTRGDGARIFSSTTPVVLGTEAGAATGRGGRGFANSNILFRSSGSMSLYSSSVSVGSTLRLAASGDLASESLEQPLPARLRHFPPNVSAI
jgi:hypothetical protein